MLLGCKLVVDLDCIWTIYIQFCENFPPFVSSSFLGICPQEVIKNSDKNLYDYVFFIPPPPSSIYNSEILKPPLSPMIQEWINKLW